jgi:hypothetical protein
MKYKTNILQSRLAEGETLTCVSNTGDVNDTPKLWLSSVNVSDRTYQILFYLIQRLSDSTPI